MWEGEKGGRNEGEGNGGKGTEGRREGGRMCLRREEEVLYTFF